MRYMTFGLVLISFFYMTKLFADDSHDIYIPGSANALSNVFRHTIDSRYLKNHRVIDVSLPVNYLEATPEIKYPLIVVLDGELLFHSVSGVVQLQAMNSQMPEAIVVSIPNAADSRRDMTPKLLNREGEPLWFGGKEENYLSFVRNEVLPFIDENYRVADFRMLIGLSPTANLVLHAFWKQPDLFSGYIAVNGTDFDAVGYGGESAFEKIIESVKQQGKNKRYLYISMPEEGVVRNPEISESYKRLANGLTPYLDEQLGFRWETIDKKAYATVLPAIMSGLELIFPPDEWDPDYRNFIAQEPDQTLINIKTHFSRLSQKYGFTALPKGERFYNRNRLKRVAYIFMSEKRYAEAESVIRYWLSLYPKSANAHDTLADLYQAHGKINVELEYRIKALELAKTTQDQRAPIFESALNQLKERMSTH